MKVRTFAYNSNTGITYDGTTNYGNLNVSNLSWQEGSNINLNNLMYYNGPDEDVDGYIISTVYNENTITTTKILQLDLGDGTFNTPTVNDWSLWCYDDVDENFTSLYDILTDNLTNWNISRTNSILGSGEGSTGSTYYPLDVQQFMNSYSGSTIYTIGGLDNNKYYDLEFWGSTTRSYEDGTTIWTVGSNSVNIEHRDYIGGPVYINNVIPTNGDIDITVSKGGLAQNWYWSVLIVKEKTDQEIITTTTTTNPITTTTTTNPVNTTTTTSGDIIQTMQLNLGDIIWNTPTVSGWDRWCSDDINTNYGPLNNTLGNSTGWYLTRSSSVFGQSEGYIGGGSGYPEDVEKYGAANSDTITVTITGLNNSNLYDFRFLSSTVRYWENSNGTTSWTIESNTVNIIHRDYSGDVVTINNISPNSGEIEITISKGNDATNWYWTAMVIIEK